MDAGMRVSRMGWLYICMSLPANRLNLCLRSHTEILKPAGSAWLAVSRHSLSVLVIAHREMHALTHHDHLLPGFSQKG